MEEVAAVAARSKDGKPRQGKDNEKEKEKQTNHTRVLESLADILATKYDPKKNVTPPVMTKYERAIVLGERIEQIARGAQPFTDVQDLVGELRNDLRLAELVAERELMERKLPFVIKRALPNGKIEYWRIEDMIVY